MTHSGTRTCVLWQRTTRDQVKAVRPAAARRLAAHPSRSAPHPAGTVTSSLFVKSCGLDDMHYKDGTLSSPSDHLRRAGPGVQGVCCSGPRKRDAAACRAVLQVPHRKVNSLRSDRQACKEHERCCGPCTSAVRGVPADRRCWVQHARWDFRDAPSASPAVEQR